VAHTSVSAKAVLTVSGKQYKDLNGNGTLEKYEDWRYLEICRARDLVPRMSLDEKIALMSESSSIGSGTTDGTVPADVQGVIVDGHVRQALIRFGTVTGPQLAAYLNSVQELCETQPLGIPFVVTGDPVHGFGLSTNATTGAQTLSASAVVSPWPQPLGLGAINDTEVTHLYGDTVRREFMAMGFRWLWLRSARLPRLLLAVALLLALYAEVTLVRRTEARFDAWGRSAEGIAAVDELRARIGAE